MTAMKKPEITSRILPVSPTSEEIDERAKALAKSVATIARLEKAAKLAAAEWKEKISDEKEVSTKLSNAVNNGVEEREVQCEVRISGNIAEVVRLDTFEVIDVRPATKTELRNRDYQTTIYDHGADASTPAPATEPQSESVTPEVIDAEVIESAPTPLAIEAKETEEETTPEPSPEPDEVPLRVSDRLLQTVLLGKDLDATGKGGTVFRHGGSHYIVEMLHENGDADALRVKMADLYPGETKEFNRYSPSWAGMIVTDTEGEKWAIVSDTVYNVTTEIKAEAE